MQLCMRVHYQPNEQTTEMLEEEEDDQPEELEDKQLIRSRIPQEKLAHFNLCPTQETDVHVPERSQIDEDELKFGI